MMKYLIWSNERGMWRTRAEQYTRNIGMATRYTWDQVTGILHNANAAQNKLGITDLGSLNEVGVVAPEERHRFLTVETADVLDVYD